MKVLLVSANPFTTPHPVYPLGLDYVAASARDHHEVRIVDLLVEETSLADEVRQYAPDVIGISLRNIDNCDVTDPFGLIRHYQELISEIRVVTSSPIVLGGAGFTIFPEKLLAKFDADYGIAGEGHAFADLLSALENGKNPVAIPGVITKGNPPTEPERSPNAFERIIPKNSPHLRHYLDHGGILNMQTKRGCPFRCVYCTYPAIEGRNLRMQAPEEAAHIAKRLEEAGAKYLFITDSVFNADVEHSLAVARAFSEVGLTIPWGGYFSPVKPDDGYFQTLKGHGLSHIEFGTDTLSDSMLSSYRKPFRVKDAIEAHRQAVDAGVHIAHFLALGGPGECEATLTETLDNADKLDQCAIFFFAGLRIFPGTGLHETAMSEGQITEGTDLLEPIFYQPEAINLVTLMEIVNQRAEGRIHWIVGAGGEKMNRVVARFYERGYTGPLWEKLIR